MSDRNPDPVQHSGSDRLPEHADACRADAAPIPVGGALYACTNCAAVFHGYAFAERHTATHKPEPCRHSNTEAIPYNAGRICTDCNSYLRPAAAGTGRPAPVLESDARTDNSDKYANGTLTEPYSYSRGYRDGHRDGLSMRPSGVAEQPPVPAVPKRIPLALCGRPDWHPRHAPYTDLYGNAYGDCDGVPR